MSKAVRGFAKWTNEVLIPGKCASSGLWNQNDTWTVSCWDTHNELSLIYQDVSVNNSVHRTDLWFACNEPFENWQAWVPDDDSGLIPKAFSGDTWRRQCEMYFPNASTFGLKQNRTVDDLNAKTGGWNHVNSTRLMWSNGKYDPWRAASVSSDRRSGGPLQSTKKVPVWVIPGVSNCGDMYSAYGEKDPGTKMVMDAERAQMKEWVAEFYKQGRANRGQEAKETEERIYGHGERQGNWEARIGK